MTDRDPYTINYQSNQPLIKDTVIFFKKGQSFMMSLEVSQVLKPLIFLACFTIKIKVPKVGFLSDMVFGSPKNLSVNPF